MYHFQTLEHIETQMFCMFCFTLPHLWPRAKVKSLVQSLPDVPGAEQLSPIWDVENIMKTIMKT